MANFAQQMKNRSIAARASQAAALKIRHDAAIPRMASLIQGEADKGNELYRLKATDQDFDLWSAPAGRAYIEANGLSAQEINYADGKVLEISWSNPIVIP